MSGKCLWVGLVLSAVTLSGAVLHGCDEKKPDPLKGAAEVADKAKQAATELTNQSTEALVTDAKQKAATYLKAGKDLLDTLTGIKDEAGAKAAAPVVSTGVDAVNGFSALLSKLPPEIKTKVMETVGTQLSSLNNGLKAQVSRLEADNKLGPILGEQLKKLKFWE